MTQQPYEWPSRERWAERYSHPYWDGETGCPFAHAFGHYLSDYATPEEIAALTTALKELYRELGHELKAANLRTRSFGQQRGEGQTAWYQRFRQLPAEDQVAFQKAGALQTARTCINDVLARIRNDEIPNRTRGSNYVPEEAGGKLVAPFNARYDAAYEAARDAYIREYAATHVPDDAAWEQELERRAAIEKIRRSNANL